MNIENLDNNKIQRWIINEYEILDETKNQVKVKVNALRPITSRNGRKYTFDEMLESARTMNRKLINVNHNDQRKIGNVDWARVNKQTQIMEVNGVVNHEPYVKMVKEHDSRIKGWSVQADFRKAKCVHCPKTFDSMEELKEHLIKEEHINNIEYEPKDIEFNGLALVIEPELPGVPETSYITETIGHKPFGSLEEMVDALEKENDSWLLGKMSNKEDYKTKMSEVKAPIAVNPRGGIVVGAVAEIKEPVKAGDKKMSDKTEVKETKVENVTSHFTVEVPVPPLKEIEKIKEEIQPQTPTTLTVKETLSIQKLAESAPAKLSLGEPFAHYENFAACVEANKDKENPEAYCGSIKRQTEGETYVHRQIKEFRDKLNELIDVANKPLSISVPSDNLEWQNEINILKEYTTKLHDHIDHLPKDDLGWKELKPYDDATIKETFSKSILDLNESFMKKLAEIKPYNDTAIVKSIQETNDLFNKKISEIKPYDDKTILEKIAVLEASNKTLTETVTKQANELKETLQKLTEKDKLIEKIAGERNKVIMDQANEIQDLKQEVKESVEDKRKLQETLITRIENLEDKQGSSFKGKNPDLKKSTDEPLLKTPDLSGGKN